MRPGWYRDCSSPTNKLLSHWLARALEDGGGTKMFAVIMAGGSGTRFWPASRDRLPKQFLKITGERTMFEETMHRLRPFVADDHIYAVVGQAHRELTRQALSQSAATMLVEPVARNTAAAIGLAAIHVRRRDPDGVMIVLPADH